MTRIYYIILTCLLFAQYGTSQGKVGINTSTPAAMFHVKDSSVLFTGPPGIPSPGNPPVSGAGTRMMWYPHKAALRSGRASGAHWDKDNIGIYSFASGLDVTAKGAYSVCFGNRTQALSEYSFAIGDQTTVKGGRSTTMGVNTQANGYGSLVVGVYNDTIIGAQNVINSTTPLFVVGNGSGSGMGQRTNAFVVRKDGHVGIGNSNPGYELSILDADANGGSFLHMRASTNELLCEINLTNTAHFGTTTNTYLAFRTNNTDKVWIAPDGNVGIGSGNPSSKLHVVGDICYTGSIAACSDLRYKKDLMPLEDVLSRLKDMNTYSYAWKKEDYPDKGFTDERQIGVIAQEAQQLFPEIVTTDKDNYLRVDYTRLSVLLLAAIKEQQAEIEKIPDLEKRIAMLEQLIAEK